MSTRIGFAGLGLMGARMARQFLGKGFPLCVWNRDPKKAEPLQAGGARWPPRRRPGRAVRCRRGVRGRPRRRRARRVRRGRGAGRRAHRLSLRRGVHRFARPDAPHGRSLPRQGRGHPGGADDRVEAGRREGHAAFHVRRASGDLRRASARADGDGHEGDPVRRDRRRLHRQADRQHLHLVPARGALRDGRAGAQAGAAARKGPRGRDGLRVLVALLSVQGRRRSSSATSSSTSRSTCW